MKNLLPIFILLLLATPTLANINYTEQYCQDNHTLATRHYYDNGTTNITTAIEYEPAKYGCVNGTATQPTTINQYGGLSTIGLLTITAFILVIAWMLGKHHGFLKLMFTFLAMFFIYLTANLIHGIGQRFTGIEQIQIPSQGLNIAAQAFWWILLFAVFYFVILVIRMALTHLKGSGKDKDYGEKYGGG